MLLVNECLLLQLFISLSTQSGKFWIRLPNLTSFLLSCNELHSVGHLMNFVFAILRLHSKYLECCLIFSTRTVINPSSFQNGKDQDNFVTCFVNF
jgi:hypothetical protein